MPKDSRKTLPQILALKNQKKIFAMTAYNAWMAGMLEDAACDLILVGDSLGNVELGFENTLPVTLDDMIRATAAVTRGCRIPFICTDMPFLSYQGNIDDAVMHAGQLIKYGGAQAVKIEGAKPHLTLVERLCEIGIPVMGHIGVIPQSIHALGSYRRRGTKPSEGKELMAQAQDLEAAGVFALVLECIDPILAASITRALSIPTIGIGSGENTDGQILVTNDLLGLTTHTVPSFVKQRVNLRNTIVNHLNDYRTELEASDEFIPSEYR